MAIVAAVLVAAQLFPPASPPQVPLTYYELPVAQAYQGPSGEPGQIQVVGTVRREISISHGKADDEADWHVHLKLDRVDSGAIRAALPKLWRDRLSLGEVDNLYSEVMVLDGWDKAILCCDEFYTADVTSAFLLTGGEHPAQQWGNDQDGGSKVAPSRLVGDRVYLQGAFVADRHGGWLFDQDEWTPEIHPLDSIAFAVGDDGDAVDIKPPGTSDDITIRWRVAFFANSSFHKVNRNLASVRKARTTTWYLELPPITARVADRHMNVVITESTQRLWNSETQEWFRSRGVRSFPPATLAVDARDGRRKLKVTATMEQPDKHGGLVIRDYVVTIEPRSTPRLRGRRAGVGDYSDRVREQYTSPGFQMNYEATLLNEGLASASYRVKGPASDASWTYRYTNAAGTDITFSVTGAGYLVSNLDPTTISSPIGVAVTPANGLALGVTSVLTLVAVQSGDAARVDEIEFRTITHNGPPPEVIE